MRVRIVLFLVAGVALAACSSGGGAAMAALTSANGLDVAREVSSVAPFMIGVSSMGSTSVDILEGGGGFPCDSGFANATVNDRPPLGEISAGDSVTVTFQSCTFEFLDETVTFNGTLTVTVSEVVENDPAWRGRYVVSMGNVSLAFGLETVTLNGRITMEERTLDDVNWTTEVTGDITAVSEEAGIRTTTALRGFRYLSTFNGATSEYTISVFGILDESDFGGAVDMDTITPMRGSENDYPYVGEVFARGAGGSTVRFLILDATTVRIVIDENGDGTPEDTITMTWVDFDS